MKSPDVVFRELGELYDFYREIAKFRFKDQENKEPAASMKTPDAEPKINLRGFLKGLDATFVRDEDDHA
jgi:hypothetical protein